MNQPYLTEVKQNTVFIDTFKGYNHNLRSASGEFYAMKNMTTDHYPVLTTRTGENEMLTFSGKPNGLWEYEHNTLMVCSGKDLWVGITDSSGGEKIYSALKNSEKYFAQIGTKTVIMPDKIVYDADTNTVTQIERSVAGNSSAVIVGTESQFAVLRTQLCDLEGNVYTPVSSSSAPSDTSVYWWDTTSQMLKKYSEATLSWVIVDSPYLRLTPASSQSQTTYTATTQTLDPTISAKISEASEFLGKYNELDTLTLNNTDYVIYGTGKTGTINYVVIVEQPKTTAKAYTLKNKCPDLTHVCALNNRVWGVDNKKHELYACKLGDPTQWYNFPGLASDSYAVSLPSTTEVTGCASYANYVHFFTEDRMLKVFGDYPSNYQVAEIKCDGIAKGANKSAVVVENILFYVSPIGVMSYDGSFPTVISHCFSPNWLQGKSVVAGRDMTKYCLSVYHNEEAYGVFMYNTQSGIWVVGGDQIFASTSQLNNALAFLNSSCKLVTVYDRTFEFDKIGLKGDNIFSLDRQQWG